MKKKDELNSAASSCLNEIYESAPQSPVGQVESQAISLAIPEPMA